MLNSKIRVQINIYLSIIVKINIELNKKCPNNENLLVGISALNPKNNYFL